MKFKVGSIDHVHITVPNQLEAFSWYHEALGFETSADLKTWVPRGGPLNISADGERTILALFAGEPTTKKPCDVVAFKVDAEVFCAFADATERFKITDREGKPLARNDLVDHVKAYSFYFSDPYGNPFELTTYEYEKVKGRLPL